jgi:hypothetical protein
MSGWPLLSTRHGGLTKARLHNGKYWAASRRQLNGGRLKLSAGTGLSTCTGSEFSAIGIAWQYRWGDGY